MSCNSDVFSLVVLLIFRKSWKAGQFALSTRGEISSRDQSGFWNFIRFLRSTEACRTFMTVHISLSLTSCSRPFWSRDGLLQRSVGDPSAAGVESASSRMATVGAESDRESLIGQRDAFSGSGVKRQRRSSIPERPNYSLNLWSIMKNCIGKDLSKIPMPVSWTSNLVMTVLWLVWLSAMEDRLSRLHVVGTTWLP